jgi:hypothetical protein
MIVLLIEKVRKIEKNWKNGYIIGSIKVNKRERAVAVEIK